MSGLLIKIEFRWNRGQSLLFLLPNIKKNDEHGAQNIRQGNKTISQKNMQVELSLFLIVSGFTWPYYWL